jgi:hypothetical protein
LGCLSGARRFVPRAEAFIRHSDLKFSKAIVKSHARGYSLSCVERRAGDSRHQQQAPGAAHWTADQYSKLVDGGVVLVAEEAAEEAGQLCGFVCAKGVAGEWEIENVVVAVSGRTSLARATPML